jgi:hypothetical protein
MGKSEQLEKGNWEEQTPKKERRVSHGRANQKSPRYHGEFIDLVDESTEKTIQKKSGKTSEKNSETEKNAEKRVPTNIRKNKKKAKKRIPSGRPSEEGFFNDPKLISNKEKSQKLRDGKNSGENREELSQKERKAKQSGFENIQTISIDKREKRDSTLEKVLIKKEHDSYERSVENAEAFVPAKDEREAIENSRDNVVKEKTNQVEQNEKKLSEEKLNKEKSYREKQLKKKSSKESLVEEKQLKEKLSKERPIEGKQFKEKPSKERPITEKQFKEKSRKERPVGEKQYRETSRKDKLGDKEQVKVTPVLERQEPDEEKQNQVKQERIKQKRQQGKNNRNTADIKKSDKSENVRDESRKTRGQKEASALSWEEVDNTRYEKPSRKANDVARGDQIQGILTPSKTDRGGNQQSATEKTKIEKQKDKEPEKVKKQKKPRQPMSKRNKLILGIGIPAALFLCAYMAVSLFYTTRFVDRTSINGYDFSRALPYEVSGFFANKGETFTLEMTGLAGLEETITGEELELSISDNGQVRSLFENQNSWAWPVILMRGADYQLDLLVEYNDELLVDRVNQIACLDRTITVEPVDAKPYFNGERFVIQPEVVGTLIDPEIVISNIRASMTAYGNSLNLVEIGAYIRPVVFSDNPELVAGVERLNHYVGASITFELNPKLVVVNHEQIVDWLSWDNNFNVTFHEEMARDFMSDFMAKYSTLGTTRTFTNPLGREAEVESNLYGWDLDEETEVAEFLSNIRSGETVQREPAHFRRGSFHETGEWGDTYIQVCLTEQHMWFFVDGELELESPVVTGLAGRSQTPSGIFEILWMASPTILRGPIIDHETGEREWESPVSYWMAITWCGIGLHDATWQPYFGGNRWTYGGSQGCINLPLGIARDLYAMVGEGTMTIVHW